MPPTCLCSKEQLLELPIKNPQWLPSEKEVFISFSQETISNDGLMFVCSSVPVACRKLLRNDSFLLDNYQLDSNNNLLSISGRLPISCLWIKGSPRKKSTIGPAFGF